MPNSTFLTPHNMQRIFCARRKTKTLALLGFFIAFVLFSILLLFGSETKANAAFGFPRDYEFNYGDGEDSVDSVKSVLRNLHENVVIGQGDSPSALVINDTKSKPVSRQLIPIFNYNRDRLTRQDAEARRPLRKVLDNNGNVVMKVDDHIIAQINKQASGGTEQLVIEDNKSEADDDDSDNEDYNSYDYDNYLENESFKPGDFDKAQNLTERPEFQFEEVHVSAGEKGPAGIAPNIESRPGATARPPSRGSGPDPKEWHRGQSRLLQYSASSWQDRNLPEDTKTSRVVGDWRPSVKLSNNPSGVKRQTGHEKINQPAALPLSRGRSQPCKSPQLCETNDGKFDRGSKPRKLNAQYMLAEESVAKESLKVDKGSKLLSKLILQREVPHGENLNRRIKQNEAKDSPPDVRYNEGDRDNNDEIPTESSQYLNKIETQIPLQEGNAGRVVAVEHPATQIQTPRLPWQPGEVRSSNGMPLVVDHVFWSKDVEDLIPKGVSNSELEHLRRKMTEETVKEMHQPSWNRCGRPKNQYLVLEDGTPLCARYRDTHVKLIYGEVLSFYLARIIGLDNVPVVALTQVNSSDAQWRHLNISAAKWTDGTIAALIYWIDGLERERSRVRMPSMIMDAYVSGVPCDWHHPKLSNLSANSLQELLQWGDMILFDYITGHYDRVASMQDGADRERKPSILRESIRNLRQWQTGKLWLIDNESGLLDAYELMYHGKQMGRKFIEFHRQMLKTTCIFHKNVAQKILELSNLPKPDDILIRYAAWQDPLFSKLPPAPERVLFHRYFHTRLKEVARWIEGCKQR